MQDFLEKLSVIEQEYREEIESEDINIFDIFFLGHEEVTLHSRFISYLLDSNSHFLELFVRKILKIDEEKFITDGCEVIPNKQNKSEYEEIDILIINEKEKQAIIIENKIHAKPSIHKDAKEGYKGQLERYYNTITKGKDKNEKECKYKCDEDKTYVYYLTLYKEPTDETIGSLKKNGIFDSRKHKIDYYQIQEWLDLCIDKKEKSFLNTIIQQYLNLVKKMTTDNKTALAITNLIAENKNHCQSAYIFKKEIDENKNYSQSAYIFSKHFKDVKWHTIHRFFTELANKLNTQIPDEQLINEVAHNNKKTILKIEFNYKGNKLQIVNDDKGFTLGNLTKGTWDYFPSEIKNIRFYDFSNKETFNIINDENRKEIISKIIDGIAKNYYTIDKPFLKINNNKIHKSVRALNNIKKRGL
ncbi:hypothetical protein M2138_000273 [Dysgonomonadaceae bacterium PH5-43]|nr:hypothetical protein [Dysgonomonadaceae bacterium PH5-43]